MGRSSIAVGCLAAAVLAAAAPTGAAPGHDDRIVLTAGASDVLPSDFDGDGVEDLTIGVPGDTPPGGTTDLGGVHVSYGDGGSGTPRTRFWSPLSPAIDPLLDMNPVAMGDTIETGDVNDDGYADLFVHIPGLDIGTVVETMKGNVGGFLAIYGTPDGLVVAGDRPVQAWSQDSPGVRDVAEDDDYFGSALALGDYDGDGFDDLAVGARGETDETFAMTGIVEVLYGARRGLTAREQVIDQDTRGVLDQTERRDQAASTLAAGDFDGDGVDDLAMGVLHENIGRVADAGAVNVLYGVEGTGLTGAGDQFFHQRRNVVPGQAGAADYFGGALATGDLNGDGYDDLAVGAPGDLRATEYNDGDGSVTVVYGSTNGFAGGSSVLVSSPSEMDAQFGYSLVTGDIDADGIDDLVVGSPLTNDRRGRVDVFPGSPSGVTSSPTQTLTVDDLDVPTFVDSRAKLGSVLQLGQFDAVPGADLVMGLPGATLEIDGARHASAGGVYVAFSRDGRISTDGGEWLHQGTPGFPGDPERYDQFGHSLPGSTLTDGFW